jgi:hypothetical protein
MRKLLMTAAVFWASACGGSTGSSPDPKGAPTDSTYDELVERAKRNDQTVELTELRFAYLRSNAYRESAFSMDLRSLRLRLQEAMKAGEHAKVREIAEQMIAIRFIDLGAQKALRQSCRALGDEECAKRGDWLSVGLFKSVLAGRDGKTCATGWRVVSVDEEYFVLAMSGFRLSKQALVKDGGVCDKMEGTDETGAPATYYFDVGEMLAAEANLNEGRAD